MLCRQIVFADYPTASIEESRESVTSLLRNAQIKVIPMTKEGKFVGMATEELLRSRVSETLDDVFSSFVPESVEEDDHIFRALRLISNQHLPMVTVVNKHKEYVGVITAETLLPAVALLLGLNDSPSGSITLEMDKNEYSFRELARIVETNDAEIVQLNTYTETNTGLFIVTLKVSREDISDIVATLQRYDYRIRYYFGQETYDNELKTNYDALINYLNI